MMNLAYHFGSSTTWVSGPNSRLSGSKRNSLAVVLSLVVTCVCGVSPALRGEGFDFHPIDPASVVTHWAKDMAEYERGELPEFKNATDVLSSIRRVGNDDEFMVYEIHDWYVLIRLRCWDGLSVSVLPRRESVDRISWSLTGLEMDSKFATIRGIDIDPTNVQGTFLKVAVVGVRLPDGKVESETRSVGGWMWKSFDPRCQYLSLAIRIRDGAKKTAMQRVDVIVPLDQVVLRPHTGASAPAKKAEPISNRPNGYQVRPLSEAEINSVAVSLASDKSRLGAVRELAEIAKDPSYLLARDPLYILAKNSGEKYDRHLFFSTWKMALKNEPAKRGHEKAIFVRMIDDIIKSAKDDIEACRRAIALLCEREFSPRSSDPLEMEKEWHQSDLYHYLVLNNERE